MTMHELIHIIQNLHNRAVAKREQMDRDIMSQPMEPTPKQEEAYGAVFTIELDTADLLEALKTVSNIGNLI